MIERLFPTVGRQTSLVLLPAPVQMLTAFSAGFAAATILQISCLHRGLPTEGVPKPLLELAGPLFSLSWGLGLDVHLVWTGAVEE